MNQVMTLAEDKGIPIYYQDTDSTMIQKSGVDKLRHAYREEYGKELVGENLSQVSSDFKMKGCKQKCKIHRVYCVGQEILFT